VVAVSFNTLGELICAVVVGGRDAAVPSLPDIRTFLAARGLAAFKLPDRIHPADSLPVTSVGKVDKAALREQLAR